MEDKQEQLIQVQKLAFISEFTASTAHEIQNPLYFLNNFAEVTKELV